MAINHLVRVTQTTETAELPPGNNPFHGIRATCGGVQNTVVSANPNFVVDLANVQSGIHDVHVAAVDASGNIIGTEVSKSNVEVGYVTKYPQPSAVQVTSDPAANTATVHITAADAAHNFSNVEIFDGIYVSIAQLTATNPHVDHLVVQKAPWVVTFHNVPADEFLMTVKAVDKNNNVLGDTLTQNFTQPTGETYQQPTGDPNVTVEN